MEKEKCKIKGCNNPVDVKKLGLCKKHSLQYYRHGKILGRTSYDANEINIKENYAEITVYNENQNDKGVVLMDLDSIDKIKDYKIYSSATGYPIIQYKKEKIFLTEFLFGKLGDKQYYIFKNKNTLDCRKSNIIIGDRSEMGKRGKIPADNKTGVKGVHKLKRTGKYEAYITNKGTKYHLGTFDTLEEAKKARMEGEKHYWGKIYTKTLD